MSFPSSLIDITDLSVSQIEALFSLSQKLKTDFSSVKFKSSQAPVLAFAFFEPSTRTRMSFEVAALRLGFNVTHLGPTETTSLKKGESQEDTIENILAMGVDGLVVRCSDDLSLRDYTYQNVAIINGGWGKIAHPTQALLDAYTIWNEFEKTKNVKVLITGDLSHSRVAASNIKLFEMLGFKIRVFEPPVFHSSREATSDYSNYLNDDLEDSLKWADVVMGLRVQRERHANQPMKGTTNSYHDDYGLNNERLKLISSNAIIMHPGPINFGVEFSPKIKQDPRSRILQQVANGVRIRAALMHSIFQSRGFI